MWQEKEAVTSLQHISSPRTKKREATKHSNRKTCLPPETVMAPVIRCSPSPRTKSSTQRPRDSSLGLRSTGDVKNRNSLPFALCPSSISTCGQFTYRLGCNNTQRILSLAKRIPSRLVSIGVSGYSRHLTSPSRRNAMNLMDFPSLQRGISGTRRLPPRELC